MDIVLKNGILTYNPSRPIDFYQQRNNIRYPFSSCFVTSDVNMLVTAGYKDILMEKVPKGMQPEDWLTSLFDLPEVDKESERLGINPNQDRFWYSMHEFVLNKYIFDGERKVYTAYDRTIQQIVYKVINKKPVVVGGKFTDSGHMVCVVGIQTEQTDIMHITSPESVKIEMLLNLIIDDPYGNPLTDYKDVRGNDVALPVNIFDRFTPRKHCIMLV